MLKKTYYLAVLFAALIITGCNEESVSPQNGVLNKESSNRIVGETQFVKTVNSGSVNQQKDGAKQIRNRVSIFKDISNDPQLAGIRTIEFNHNFDSNNEGYSYGVFTLETKNSSWEGDWTSTTTSIGTTIHAVGYSLNDRDQYCEWKYFFPSSNGEKSGTYSAVIYYDRDQQF